MNGDPTIEYRISLAGSHAADNPSQIAEWDDETCVKRFKVKTIREQMIGEEKRREINMNGNVGQILDLHMPHDLRTCGKIAWQLVQN